MAKHTGASRGGQQVALKRAAATPPSRGALRARRRGPRQPGWSAAGKGAEGRSHALSILGNTKWGAPQV